MENGKEEKKNYKVNVFFGDESEIDVTEIMKATFISYMRYKKTIER